MYRTSAHWMSHVNGIGAPASMRSWLSDRASLTAKLMHHCKHFRVQRLRQENRQCLPDEHRAIGLPRRQIVQEREVILRCDELPVVYAHTVVPLASTASDWPFFGTLGERSLGTTLFGDPRVSRGELEYAKLHPGHPLARRVIDALGLEYSLFPLFARRCLFKRKGGVLLVTEVFLPAVQALQAMPLASRQRINDQQPLDG